MTLILQFIPQYLSIICNSLRIRLGLVVWCSIKRFNKDDAWLSIGDIGTWQNGIILYSMHEKVLINTYNKFWFKKCEKNVTDVSKGKPKEMTFPS